MTAPGTAPIDPFVERISWFKVIGRSFTLLKNLLYEVPIEQELFITDEKGHVIGRIRVAIYPGQPRMLAREHRPTSSRRLRQPLDGANQKCRLPARHIG